MNKHREQTSKMEGCDMLTYSSLEEYNMEQKDRYCCNNNFFTTKSQPSFQIETVYGNQLILNCGMSTEICLAKTIAFKKNYIYQGWKVGAMHCQPTLITDTIQAICNYYKSDIFSFNSAMFNPGFCSVPYVTIAANMLYLPSQILVGFNSFLDLKKMVQTANEQGISCYAVAGYDGAIPDKCVAWIKFLSIPRQFVDLCKNYSIKDILTLCVYDENKKTTGEKVSRLAYRDSHYSFTDSKVYANDIYFLYIHESYGQSSSLDTKLFNKLIHDIPFNIWSNLAGSPKREYMSDWESGMDTIEDLNPVKETDNLYSYSVGDIKGTIITVKDTVILYELATPIAKAFMEKNQIDVKGVVLNPYFISDPIYEMNYGYIPLLYWQGNSENTNILSSRLKKYCKNSSLKIYANNFKGLNLPVLNTEGVEFIFEKYIENSDPICRETVEWIKKHRLSVYNNVHLDFKELFYIIKNF